MAKRFTDTDKWKKPFIKNLPAKYKLLWFYIIDDCDIAGLWQVDFDVAKIRIGEDVNSDEAINLFGESIVIIDAGEKWFIPGFLEFQYGSQLSKTNNIYKSIEKILLRYNLFQYLNVEITEYGTTISSFRNRISRKIKEDILLKADLVCEYCQERKSVHELVIDHFIPLNKNGNNSEDNLVCSCIRCNSYKTDSDPEFFLSKQHVFLNPSEKIKKLLIAYKKLKGAYKPLEGAKDKDKEQYKDKDKDKEQDKYKEIEKKYPIEDCKRIALFDERFTKANKTNDSELLLFNGYLERQGEYEFNPAEYKKYFGKLKGKYPTMLKKEYTVDELRELSKTMQL